MRTYETIFITQPALTEDDDRAALDGFAQVVEEQGGALSAKERMGRRRLAYVIQKAEEGVYHRLLYDSEAAVPKELERRLRISDKVLRHLTVRLEPDWAVAAKEQAVRDAEARAAAEAAREAGLEAAAQEAESASRDGDDDAESDDDSDSDEDES